MDIKKINKYLQIIIGMVILSFGLYNIHSRCDISEGGVLGLSLLFKQWFNISPSITSIVADSTCFVIGIIFLGKSFLFDSILASVSFSLFYRLFEYKIGPLLPSFNDKLLLAAVVGAMFVGVGVGLVVRNGTAAGGDDAIALVLNKKFNIKVSTTYIVLDTLILTLSLSYIPFKRIFYSLISVWLSGYIIELIHKKKS